MRLIIREVFAVVALLCMVASCTGSRAALTMEESMTATAADTSLAVRGERVETREERRGTATHRMTLAPVAPEAATLGVSLTSLLDLPEGAGYHSRSGRAEVALMREGDGITVTANCDSLQRLCELWEEEREESSIIIDSLICELHAARREILHKEREAREEREQRSNGAQTVLKWLLIGMAAGIAGTIILIIKTNKK